MESNDIKPLMKRYFREISALYHRGDSPGNIAYCRVLKDLLNQTFKCFAGNFTQYNFVIDILEIPPGLQIQIPCMRLWDGKAKIYGYIDVLDPGTTTKETREYPWLALYKRVFPNLLLTNFLKFLYYRERRKVFNARPFNVSHMEEITGTLKTNRADLFLKGLRQFMSYSTKKFQIPDIGDLQKRLALKTDYLKEYILTPLMEHLRESRAKCELDRLYRAYCYYFDRELSIKEFSAFLAHVIIDGFLRAGIFYGKFDANQRKPFPRRQLFKFAKFNRVPDRRLALFKYLSMGTVGPGLPVALRWALDDIGELVANFDFKEIDFHCENPGLIDGALLQWDYYFFIPYFIQGEKETLKELLIKEGIFSSKPLPKPGRRSFSQHSPGSKNLIKEVEK